eukprot:GDKJ01022252.1.p1 GENE.GDKJ01022252.1~~GDKJ01022252.1.p1  ORF type:complete len:273 (+),score=72.24 GDKJ01022252.1:13-831(+)
MIAQAQSPPITSSETIGRTTYAERQVHTYPQNEHPLETSWSFWYEKKANYHKQTTDDYQKGLKELGSCSTVEELARVMAFLRPASKQPGDHNLAFFRKGTMPMWEDMPNGGHFILKIPKRAGAAVIDGLWETIVIACGAEAFNCSDVCGVVLSCRSKEDVISIWNETTTSMKIRAQIECKLREMLQLPAHCNLHYKDNRSALAAVASFKSTAAPVPGPSGLLLNPTILRLAFTPNIESMTAPASLLFGAGDLDLPAAVMEEDEEDEPADLQI